MKTIVIPAGAPCGKCANAATRALRGRISGRIHYICGRCRANALARARRHDRDEAMASIGMVKVHGALGGTYYE